MLFLVHGNPNGLRTAELSNWSGKAISAPRNDLPAFFHREELSSPGVYLLTGEDSDTGDKTIYIGEAEDVRKRIKNHIDKDFWNSATVFISKDDNLTKSHIKYLEGKKNQGCSTVLSCLACDVISQVKNFFGWTKPAGPFSKKPPKLLLNLLSWGM